MGSLLPALVGFNTICYNQLLGPTKMLSFLSLASLLALSQAAVLPAGINAATCTNYPFCGPSQISGPANVPANTAAYKAIKQLYVAQPAIPEIPGLEAHAAAENAQLARMGAPARPIGYQAHMAAEARLVQQQQQVADINNSYY